MLERELYARLIEALKREGIAAFRLGDGVGKQPFDLCAIGPCGVFIGIEVKVADCAGGTLGLVLERPLPAAWFRERDHQRRWLRRVERLGGFGFVLVVSRYGRGPTMLFRAREDQSSVVYQDWWDRPAKDLLVATFDGFTPDVGWKWVTYNG
jgi:hypothetical protein